MTSVHAKTRELHAFTLTELVVLVCVVGVLACLLAANALRNSSSVKRAQCAGNLRQFGLALQISGNENEGRLLVGSAGTWAWDIPTSLGSFVESTGCKWTVMYCPGTAPVFTENDNRSLYTWWQISFRVIGYATTLPGAPTVVSSNLNNTLLPERIQLGLGGGGPPFVVPSPAERVLLADASLSASGQSNPTLQFSSAYYYVGIPGGYQKPHLSSHLSGRFPAGGNLNMLDGHVEWRAFKDMRPRTTGFSSPVFWW